MIYQDINYLVENYDFFTAVTELSNSCRCFNGFIGSSPNNEIIRNAIYDCVNIDVEQLTNEYHLLCDNLFTIINNSQEKNIKLLVEDGGDASATGVGKIYDRENLNDPVLIHYFRVKNYLVRSLYKCGLCYFPHTMGTAETKKALKNL